MEEDTSLCPHCGEIVDPGWVHCAHCGERIIKEQEKQKAGDERPKYGWIYYYEPLSLKKMFSFSGRTSRGEFFFIYAFTKIAFEYLKLEAFNVRDESAWVYALLLVLALLPGYIMLAAAVRRLYDTGKSTIYIFFMLFPYIHIYIVLLLLFEEGEKQIEYENAKEKPEGAVSYLESNSEVYLFVEKLYERLRDDMEHTWAREFMPYTRIDHPEAPHLTAIRSKLLDLKKTGIPTKLGLNAELRMILLWLWNMGYKPPIHKEVYNWFHRTFPQFWASRDNLGPYS